MKRFGMMLVCAGLVGLMPMTMAAAQKDPGAVNRPAEKRADAAPKPAALDKLLRPEAIMKFADQIGLTPQQQRAMRQEVQETRRKLADVQAQLRTDTEALNASLGEEPIDQTKVMGLLDKVLEDERTIKRANLGLAIALRSKLTAEQSAKLEELQKAAAPAERTADANAAPLAEIRKLMQEVQEKARAKQQAGGDISEVKKLVESARPLVQEGKYKEALEALEKAKGLLQLP